ncbi:MAG: hypothetical protein IT298_06685 [Chloroflexi bacterium]|jgi:multicomponent Na+:H+ antiporter subunit D|nr:hypothetical protein [Chloroflexota bacterium]MEB2365557.1 proton-conducting transporter membrane subunit [Chloroflexota bacterium]
MAHNNWLVLTPVLTHLLAGVVSLALWRFNRAQRVLGVFSGGLAALFTAALAIGVAQNGTQVYRLGGWQPPYGIALAIDGLSVFFLAMVAVVVFAAMLYTWQCADKCMKRSSYIPLALMQAAALNGTFLTGDIFTFFVFMELLVVTSVVLVAGSDNPDGIEAATKYLLISACGTLFLLIGIAMIYGSFGTLNMADIARLSAETGGTGLTNASAVVLMCAFLLKGAVFPFHFWQPDFHTTAPAPQSALLSSVVVKVGVYGLLRLITLLLPGSAPTLRLVLIMLGLIGIGFGGVTALRTHNVKRILAYSTLAQIGFILLAIGWGTPLALAAALIYAFNHALIKSALLMLAGLVASRTTTKTSSLAASHGVGYGMPWISALFFVGGLALAGIPPLNGFISKLAIVQGGAEAAQSGDPNSWVWLGLAVAGSILSLLYITNTWQNVFQKPPDNRTANLKPEGEGDSWLAPALLIGACVALGLFAAPLVDAAQSIAVQITQPALYISAVLGG